MFLSPQQQDDILKRKQWWWDEFYVYINKNSTKATRDDALTWMSIYHDYCEDIRDSVRKDYNGAFYANPNGDGSTLVDVEKLQAYIKSSNGYFISEDSAAWAFGQAYNGISIKNNVEYIANIYKKKFNDEDKYYIHQIKSGDYGSVDIPQPDSKYGTRVAKVHTHGKYMAGTGNDIFSITDTKYAASTDYVVTNGGYLIKYAKSNEQFEIVSYSMPSDPNNPNYKHPTIEELKKNIGK